MDQRGDWTLMQLTIKFEGRASWTAQGACEKIKNTIGALLLEAVAAHDLLVGTALFSSLGNGRRWLSSHRSSSSADRDSGDEKAGENGECVHFDCCVRNLLVLKTEERLCWVMKGSWLVDCSKEWLKRLNEWLFDGGEMSYWGRGRAII